MELFEEHLIDISQITILFFEPPGNRRVKKRKVIFEFLFLFSKTNFVSLHEISDFSWTDIVFIFVQMNIIRCQTPDVLICMIVYDI